MAGSGLCHSVAVGTLSPLQNKVGFQGSRPRQSPGITQKRLRCEDCPSPHSKEVWKVLRDVQMENQVLPKLPPPLGNVHCRGALFWLVTPPGEPRGKAPQDPARIAPGVRAVSAPTSSVRPTAPSAPAGEATGALWKAHCLHLSRPLGTPGIPVLTAPLPRLSGPLSPAAWAFSSGEPESCAHEMGWVTLGQPAPPRPAGLFPELQARFPICQEDKFGHQI